MQDRVGEDFDAMILSATKYGLFVELTDLFVEGLVPIQTLGALDNDYYTFRENTREIIGERWGRRFRIGQRVRVLLDRIDAVQKRLQFSIVEDEKTGLKEQGSSTKKGAPSLRPGLAQGWKSNEPRLAKIGAWQEIESERRSPACSANVQSRARFPRRKRRSAANEFGSDK